jgi:hypothetical protein
MTIRLNGSTSGYTELDAPAVAGAGVLTLPTGVGTLLTAEGGKVLQIVRATDVTNRTTTSTSFVDASISVTITPQKSTSAVLVVSSSFIIPFDASSATVTQNMQITDSSNNAISGAEAAAIGTQNFTYTGNGTHRQMVVLVAYATPATTSPVTFKLRFKSEVATTTSRIFNATTTGQMYAIEVGA